MRRIERHYELSTVPAEGIAQLHAALDTFWAEAEVTTDIQIRFGTALAEVVANILQYAVTPGDAPIRLRLRCSPQRLEARVVDNGKAWAMPAATLMLPDDWEESGRGLAIAQAFLDTLQYRRLGNVNCWRLVLSATTD
ncbi:ATP-binding protein [Chloroflexus sp.]|uniref:ATP-binding protein n=1 Tax=Chloroflexus sp. TaxID=1904827 RepID=UPI002626C49D|nr:ATP-binding protein [uncultured Chloroflexus sp.]